MKWQKRGLLFQPQQHALPDGCRDFAQSPQALVFDDFVRIYFSTRSRDAAGLFVSHIAYADVDLAVSRVLRTSTKTVVAPGGLGCFDEHGIFPIDVVRHQDRLFAFLSGWSRRVSVPVETAIGLAESHDGGETFERLGPGPVMAPTLTEPFLVGDPFVVIRDGVWHMWYIYGTSWADSPSDPGPARVYKIAHANSADGVDWRRDGLTPIADTLDGDECQALPTVFEHEGAWHMYFCYRHATDFRTNRQRGYRLGYAWSRDLKRWTRDDAAAGIDVSATGWDADMLCYPHVFHCDGSTFMLYNGNAFGRDGFGVAVLEA